LPEATPSPCPGARLLFALEPVASVTRLTFTAEGEPGGFFGVAAPLVRKSLKDTMTSDLKA